MFKNRYIDAIAKTMLFSAAVHMIILFYKTFQTADINILNLFNILDLELFFPGIDKGGINFLLSSLLFFVIYFSAFFFFPSKKKN
jgi:hypothetical protein